MYLYSYDKHLPQHLRLFTAGAVYTRLLTMGVEVLQFTKRYSEAVEQLRFLLNQDVYHVDYRGRWYDRLALNLDYHLKQPLQVQMLCAVQLSLLSLLASFRLDYWKNLTGIGAWLLFKKKIKLELLT